MRRILTLVLAGCLCLGAAGCVMVPAGRPVAVARPLVVAPPVVVHPGYGGGHRGPDRGHGHGRPGHWR